MTSAELMEVLTEIFFTLTTCVAFPSSSIFVFVVSRFQSGCPEGEEALKTTSTRGKESGKMRITWMRAVSEATTFPCTDDCALSVTIPGSKAVRRRRRKRITRFLWLILVNNKGNPGNPAFLKKLFFRQHHFRPLQRFFNIRQHILFAEQLQQSRMT